MNQQRCKFLNDDRTKGLGFGALKREELVGDDVRMICAKQKN